MTCRHSPGDPNCSSSPYNPNNPANIAAREKDNRIAELEKQLASIDADKYEILDVHRISTHVALKVKYPSCPKCDYEGVKVLVFLNVSEIDILKWRRIDPHFRRDDPKRPVTHAPSPAARFPASDKGWEDAKQYMEKQRETNVLR